MSKAFEKYDEYDEYDDLMVLINDYNNEEALDDNTSNSYFEEKDGNETENYINNIKQYQMIFVEDNDNQEQELIYIPLNLNITENNSRTVDYYEDASMQPRFIQELILAGLNPDYYLEAGTTEGDKN